MLLIVYFGVCILYCTMFRIGNQVWLIQSQPGQYNCMELSHVNLIDGHFSCYLWERNGISFNRILSNNMMYRLVLAH